MSALRFLPKVYRCIAKDVQIISARSRYEKKFPRAYDRWKVEAFLECKKDLEEHAITNLIAFGDNKFEMEAAHILGEKFHNSMIKTVKFKANPTPAELIKQINLVNESFD
jgi:hypothetical protein